jgi:hypothetical protein
LLFRLFFLDENALFLTTRQISSRAAPHSTLGPAHVEEEHHARLVEEAPVIVAERSDSKWVSSGLPLLL